VSLHISVVITCWLRSFNQSRRGPSLKPREVREPDDRRYVATKLVNIAQSFVRKHSARTARRPKLAWL